MSAKPEPGQSQASADACERLMEAGRVAASARWEVTRLNRELRAARAAVKAAEAAERAADAEYIATPYPA